MSPAPSKLSLSNPSSRNPPWTPNLCQTTDQYQTSHFFSTTTSNLITFLSVAFTLGVMGNGFALWIFCLHLKPWRSSMILLFNLALADTLLLMALPFRISYYSSNFQWKFGSTFCNICHFLVGVNRCGSTLFLIGIALDRYMRVVHPHHPVNSMSVYKSACGVTVLWLLTVVVSIFFTLHKYNKGYCGDFSSQCERNHTMSGQRLGFLLAFYLPFLVILFSTVSIVQHLRQRRIAQHAQVKKALSVMISIVILFAVCFLPSNITQLVIWIKARTMATQSCAEIEQMAIIYSLTMSSQIVHLQCAVWSKAFRAKAEGEAKQKGASLRKFVLCMYIILVRTPGV
uniref:G-protein coupled receptors family 1 profile domain-containing protein n=1 Tax=Periophthalmus magnuspinnatus TaxID=409849 RepID=A0A3B3Z8X2_9GOBI